MIAEEEFQAAADAVQLYGPEREACRLFEVEGMTEREIGRLMGLKVPKVRELLDRSQAALDRFGTVPRRSDEAQAHYESQFRRYESEARRVG